MRRRLHLALGAGSLALLLGAWWWVRNLIDFGVLQPAGYVGPHVSPGTDFWYFLISAARDISASSWGRLGWLDWNLSSVLVGALAAGSFVTVGCSEFFGRDRLRKLTLLAYYPLTIALLFLQALTKYREDGTVPGVQGRYLFPSIVALVVIAATAWWPVLEEAMSRWSRSLIALPGVVSFSIAVLDWCSSCYPSESGRLGVDWVRWSLVAGFDISWLKILVILSLLGVACACTIPVVLYRRQHHVENTVTQPRVSEPVTG